MDDQFKKALKFTSTDGPERQGINFEKMKPKIIESSDETWPGGKREISGVVINSTYTGKTRRLFINHIRTKYKNKYYIPGPEYENYLLSLATEQVPEELKGSTTKYLIGLSSNDSEVHTLVWDGHKFIIGKLPLEGKIDVPEAVILLEKK